MSFKKEGHFLGREIMEDKLTFEELYEAYNLCLKNKKKKYGTYNFTNIKL